MKVIVLRRFFSSEETHTAKAEYPGTNVQL